MILGNSCALVVGARPGSPPARTYADHLRDAGVQVCNRAIYQGLITDAVRTWASTVLPYRPDLLVLNFGLNESTSALPPRLVHRRTWGFSNNDRLTMRVLQRFLRANWRRALRAQSVVDGRWMPGPVSASRYGKQLTRLVMETTIHVGHIPIVIVPAPPMTPPLRTLSRQYERRRLELALVERECASRHGNVHLLDVSTLLPEIDSKMLLPDGLHFGGQAHAEIARLVQRLLIS